MIYNIGLLSMMYYLIIALIIIIDRILIPVKKQGNQLVHMMLEMKI